MKLKAEVGSDIDSLNQIVPHIEKAKDLAKLKIEELNWKNKNLSSENPFHYIEYLEMQKGKNDIDLGLKLELAEDNKII